MSNTVILKPAYEIMKASDPECHKLQWAGFYRGWREIFLPSMPLEADQLGIPDSEGKNQEIKDTLTFF